MKDRYYPVIGLEIHAQLKTASKAFCRCANRFGADPNSLTCPVCLGLPGALPVLNQKMVSYGIMLGLATHCRISRHSRFARKNYFYPDLPKGFQITQYKQPLCTDGKLTIFSDTIPPREIRIRRIHLEEDAGKSIHDNEGSLLDYNRCGVPLLEIVTEPDIRSAREARLLVKQLKQILEFLDISDGNMEEGSLRCDANISVTRSNDPTETTRTEIKNLNSTKALEKALSYEFHRQRKRIEKGQTVLPETLLWDERKAQTQPLRGKEEIDDYRYFAEPDLPPLVISAERTAELKRNLPRLPEYFYAKLIRQYGLSFQDADLLISSSLLRHLFEEINARVEAPKLVSKWLNNELLSRIEIQETTPDDFPLPVDWIIELLRLLKAGEITHTQADNIWDRMIADQKPPQHFLDSVVTSIPEGELQKIVRSVVENHPDQVKKYRKGKKGVINYLVGQVIRTTKGRTDPEEVMNRLRDELAQDS